MDKIGASPDKSRDEIEAMVHEAHRRPAYPVRGPAVLRHRSFLYEKRDEIAATVARYARSLPDSDWDDRNVDLLESRLLTIRTDGTLASTLRGWRFRVRIEIHAEYVSVTFIIDSFDEAFRGQNALFDTLHAISRNDCREETASATIESLFEFVWRDVERVMRGVAMDEFGKLFADFRGLAILPAPMAPMKHGENEVQMPDGDTTRARRSMVIDATLRDFVRSRTNLLAATLDLKTNDGDAARQPTNVVMCGMLDGAAIYASSLGAAGDREWHPQRYFVAYNGSSANQLGRFLRRLHVQGEVRLAGLIDLVTLRFANDEIARLNADADKYVPILSNARDDFEPENVALSGLQTRLWKIGSDCRGGLRYRVSQSKHYAQAFRERMEDLRIVRIEGWQPYDVFVRRNLYKSYDFISRVGEAYNALALKLGTLNVLQQTRSITVSTRQTKDLLRYAELVGLAAFVYYVGSMIGTALSQVPVMVHAIPLPLIGTTAELVRGAWSCSPQWLSRLCGLAGAQKDTLKIVGWFSALVIYLASNWFIKRHLLARFRAWWRGRGIAMQY